MPDEAWQGGTWMPACAGMTKKRAALRGHDGGRHLDLEGSR
jgi:hypothetical protein